MDTIFEVPADGDGERLDLVLGQLLPGLSRSAAQKLMDNGLVTCGGRAVKKNTRVRAGDLISVRLPDPEPAEARPENIPLDIVWEDSDIIVINKPRGMVVHPAPGHPDGTLVNALLYHCGAELSGIGGVIRPGIVHRIDKDTSGLLVAAKNDAAHAALSAQLADHSLSRIYQAVVCGRLRDDEGTVSAPIGRHPSDRKRMTVTDRNGRPAVTHYRVLARYNGYTHVECRLETGRTHQIRVHMAYIGHPLLGDMVYGRKKPEKGLEGQCLHAAHLKLIHPSTGQLMTFDAPLPAWFSEALSRLGPKE